MDTLALKNRIRDYLEDADERVLQIINAVIESESENEYSMTKAQKAELDRRAERHERGETKSYSWEEAKQKIRSRG